MASLSAPKLAEIRAELATIRSKRMRILMAIRRIIETIDSDDGYASTVSRCDFSTKGWREIPEEQTPCVFVIDDEQAITPHAGCVREYKWSIHLMILMKNKTIIQFEEFMADVEECLYDNNTLTGEVAKVEVPTILTDGQVFLDELGLNIANFRISVDYTRGARNPR